MPQFKTTFSIQDHHQKKSHSSHFDLRILNQKKSSLWSWAIPKSKFPIAGERVLAIRTVNHKVSYMHFDGELENGDTVKLFDKGKCRVIIVSQNLLIFHFIGSKIRGTYNFIRLLGSDDAWMIQKSKYIERG